MKNWSPYYKKVGDKPNPLVQFVVEEFPIMKNAALDLGAGNLRDAKYLLREGFARVIAVDRSEVTKTYVIPGIELESRSIESYVPPKESFDLAVSCFTLFFLSISEVQKVFERIHSGLRQGGIFACNVLGENDGWVKDGAPVSYFTERSVQLLRNEFSLLHEKEAKFYAERERGRSSASQKFWHQRIMVLRKE